MICRMSMLGPQHKKIRAATLFTTLPDSSFIVKTGSCVSLFEPIYVRGKNKTITRAAITAGRHETIRPFLPLCGTLEHRMPSSTAAPREKYSLLCPGMTGHYL